MDFNEYEKRALETRVPEAAGIVYSALGLTGEVGEVADKVKKSIRDCGGGLNNEDKNALLKELGDVLWYLTALINDLDLSLDSVMTKNVEKLKERYPEGFKKVKKVCS